MAAAVLSLTVLAAALGYFADIFDIVLFSMVRVASCKELGLDPQTQGMILVDWQMGGMLAGGLLWGVIGDVVGRRTAMFASILTYSIANLLNAAVGHLGFGDAMTQYGVVRFISGFGLAGELGAAIALVSESVGRDRRGVATMLVSSLGISGAIAAWAVSEHFHWRTAYLVGGFLGLTVLVLRMRVLESSIFDHAVEAKVRRGDPILLLRRAWRPFLLCVLAGLPLWLVVGKLAVESLAVAKVIGAVEPIDPKHCVVWCYGGLVLGDLASGLLSQWLRSRRLVMAVFLLATLGTAVLYLQQRGLDQAQMNAWCFALGVGCGYWALFVTVAAEQFATNVRATAATLIPNLVRGAVPLWSAVLAMAAGSGWAPSLSYTSLVVVVLIAALAAVWLLPESFDKDLDYVER
jgi:putative MFS transporter